MISGKNSSSFIMCMLLVICLMTSLSYSKAKASSVSARLHKENNECAIITIKTGTPPPSSLIVQLFLPPGVQFNGSFPDPSKINKKNNSIKWLFKGLSAGSESISVYLSQPFVLDTLVARIRYRNKNSGMVELDATHE